MNAQYQRMPSKCVHNPLLQAPVRKCTHALFHSVAVSPIRGGHQASSTPLKYHVKINLRAQQPVITDSPKTSDKSFALSYQRQASNQQFEQTQKHFGMTTQRLTLVKSPSTSFSPFKRSAPKSEVHPHRYLPVQNVRISLQQQPNDRVFREHNSENSANCSQRNQKPYQSITIMNNQNIHKRNKETQENDDSYARIMHPTAQVTPLTEQRNSQTHNRDNSQNENVLNETIDKLDYLERKITNIMEKNDQLRLLLKRQESTQTLPRSDAKVPKTAQYTSFNQCISNSSNTAQTVTREDTLQSIRVSQLLGIGVTQFAVSPHDRTSSFYSKSSNNNKAKSAVREKIGSTNNSTENLFAFFKCGRGKKIYPNGYMYEGEWLEGIREGLGTLFNPLGVIIYQGEWKQDFFHGRGRLVNELPMKLKSNANFKDFDDVAEAWRTYEGEFADGQKNGLGVLSFGEVKYHGHFENDVFHGNGSIIHEKDGKMLAKGCWEKGLLKK